MVGEVFSSSVMLEGVIRYNCTYMCSFYLWMFQCTTFIRGSVPLKKEKNCCENRRNKFIELICTQKELYYYIEFHMFMQRSRNKRNNI